jgi:hypothetical protein
MTGTDPIPELCHHDDPSWCGPDCAAKVDAFDAWMRRKLSIEKQEAYGRIITIAAELARCSHMPSEHDDDQNWYRSTPIAERRRILEENEKACNYSRELAQRLRRAADDLVRRIT